MNIMVIIAIVAYMAAVIWIGINCSRKNASADDFYLGGRRLGPFVTAMSAEASDMSSWLLMGLPGVALIVGGFAEAFWTALGLAIGTYLNWLLVSKRIRRYSERIGADTIPDFFSRRFNDKSGALLAISAVIIILFFVPYTGSGFAAVGKLFNSLFGMDYHLALIIGAAVIACYTVIGGFLAASTTDFMQSIVMTIALFVVICYGVSDVGGINIVADNIKAIPSYFSLTGTDGSYNWVVILSTLAWGLGYFGMPHILLRFMAIKDERKLKLSRRIASVWVVISMACAILIGIVGYVFAVKNGAYGTAGFDSERIIIYIADAISRINPLFAILAGVILAGILAATMSTADSQLLAASSSVSENLIHRFFWKDMSKKTGMLIARITVLLISVVGVIFAWNPESSVFDIVSFAWAGFGASFGPLVLFSLFWRRTTKWGALAGMIAGGATAVIWEYVLSPISASVAAIYELLPAFIISSVVIVVVSLVTPRPDEKTLSDYDAVKAMK